MFYRLQSYYFGLILIILHTKIKGKFEFVFKKKIIYVNVFVAESISSFYFWCAAKFVVLKLQDLAIDIDLV